MAIWIWLLFLYILWTRHRNCLFKSNQSSKTCCFFIFMGKGFWKKDVYIYMFANREIFQAHREIMHTYFRSNDFWKKTHRLVGRFDSGSLETSRTLAPRCVQARFSGGPFLLASLQAIYLEVAICCKVSLAILCPFLLLKVDEYSNYYK